MTGTKIIDGPSRLRWGNGSFSNWHISAGACREMNRLGQLPLSRQRGMRTTAAAILLVLVPVGSVFGAELAPKGTYVDTSLTCAQYHNGDGSAASYVIVSEMRISAGPAYCDLTPTGQPDEYLRTCRALALGSEGLLPPNPATDPVESEAKITFRKIAADTIELSDGQSLVRQFKFCPEVP